MESGKNSKSKKNKRSSKVFSVIEEVYSREWYLREVKELGKYKGSSNRI